MAVNIFYCVGEGGGEGRREEGIKGKGRGGRREREKRREGRRVSEGKRGRESESEGAREGERKREKEEGGSGKDKRVVKRAAAKTLASPVARSGTTLQTGHVGWHSLPSPGT